MLDANNKEIKFGDTMIFEGKISRLDEETEQCFIKNESGTAGNWYFSRQLILKEVDVREKVKEYIGELDTEYDRCMDWIEEHMDSEACQVSAMEMRAKTLMEVKNDLQSRLEELVWKMESLRVSL